MIWARRAVVHGVTKSWTQLSNLTELKLYTTKAKKQHYQFQRQRLSYSLLNSKHTQHIKDTSVQFSSVQFSCSVVSDSLQPHESRQARPPCPSPTPGVHSDSPPSSQWCHPAISSSVVPFFSFPQSLPASKSFPMSQLFAWGGQSQAQYSENEDHGIRSHHFMGNKRYLSLPK